MTSQWCDEAEAMRKIEGLESSAAFAALVESAVLAPYRRWAAGRDEIDAYVNARPFVERAAFLAAAKAIPSFVSLRQDYGPSRVTTQQGLIDALAAKLTDAAMQVIEEEATVPMPVDTGAD